jgi:hypothetical protein
MSVNYMTHIRVFISTILFILFTPVLISADSWSVSPAFDDHVSGSTSLVNMQSFAMESKLKIRAVGDDAGPAGVEYMVSISPIIGSDAAIGTVRTDFRGSILEARGIHHNESARNEWRDSSMVSGAIVNFMKSFTYTSGIKL